MHDSEGGLGSKVTGRSASAVAKRTAISAVVGGTISKAVGGKFANGAVSASFTHLFNNEVADSWREEASEEASRVEKISEADLENWKQWKIQQGITEAKGIGSILVVAGGVGLAARAGIWLSSFASPLKYTRWGRLQPYSSSTGRYLPSSSLYTNGEYLLFRSTPYLNGAADFVSSSLPGIPAANLYGAFGMGTGLAVSPENWTH